MCPLLHLILNLCVCLHYEEILRNFWLKCAFAHHYFLMEKKYFHFFFHFDENLMYAHLAGYVRRNLPTSKCKLWIMPAVASIALNLTEFDHLTAKKVTQIIFSFCPLLFYLLFLYLFLLSGDLGRQSKNQNKIICVCHIDHSYYECSWRR